MNSHWRSCSYFYRQCMKTQYSFVQIALSEIPANISIMRVVVSHHPITVKMKLWKRLHVPASCWSLPNGTYLSIYSLLIHTSNTATNHQCRCRYEKALTYRIWLLQNSTVSEVAHFHPDARKYSPSQALSRKKHIFVWFSATSTSTSIMWTSSKCSCGP